MYSGFAPRGGLALIRTASARQLARRRLALVICAMAGLAILAGLIGSLTGAAKPAQQAVTQLSYFPAQ